MSFSLQDLTAAIVSILLIAGALALVFTDRAIPGELTGALGMALTWVFVRSMNAASRNGGGSS